MKKLLLITAICTFISTSTAIANDQGFSKSMYFKLEGGISQFNKIKGKLVDKHSKFKIVPQIGLGFGGYIADRVRADIIVNHAFNPQAKYSNNSSFGQAVSTPLDEDYFNNDIKRLRDLAANPDYFIGEGQKVIEKAINKLIANPSSFTSIRNESINSTRQSLLAEYGDPAVVERLINNQVIPVLNNILNNVKESNLSLYNLLITDFSQAKIDFKINRKSKVESAMINGYFDIVDVANFKIFAGAGVGLAVLHEKIVGSANLMVGDKVLATLDKTKGQKKIAKNFAYALKLGASVKVADNVDLDLTGEFKDFGRTKSVKLANIEIGKARYRSYGATAGMRFSF